MWWRCSVPSYLVLWCQSDSLWPHVLMGTSVVSNSLWPQGLYSPWNSPGQNTGGGSLSLLQVIFPTQESNSGLPHCRWILYQLSHQRSPRILEWVAYPFSRGSSQSRNQTGVSCIACRFFTIWATREAHKKTPITYQVLKTVVLWWLWDNSVELGKLFDLYWIVGP